MWKSLLAGTAALAITGSSLVYAQQRDHGPGARWHPSQEDRAAFTDARIAALKAGLRLTPDQEKNWPAFETAWRDIAKARGERMADRKDGSGAQGTADPVERMRRHAEMMSNAAASLNQLADAQEPLYQSLDDSQKKRFLLLSKVVMSGQRHFAQMRQHGRDHERGARGHDRSDQNGPRGTEGRGGPRNMQHDNTGADEQL
jgi:zinc resistance-associated protein